jgi:hypothetical protein
MHPSVNELAQSFRHLARPQFSALTPLLTHTFPLDEIRKAYEFFGSRRDGALKVAIRVHSFDGPDSAASCLVCHTPVTSSEPGRANRE